VGRRHAADVGARDGGFAPHPWFGPFSVTAPSSPPPKRFRPTWGSARRTGRTVTQPSRAITKEGPEELRLAFYLATNAARTVDPQLAWFDRKLMCERGHCHAQATTAVARKLVARTWAA
jgi:hypothetical protein